MRYFFHIRNGDSLIVDPDGTELDGVPAAMAEARDSARELIAHRVMSGDHINGQVFEVTNDQGEIVGHLAFKDVIH
jgi:hypothetical protein